VALSAHVLGEERKEIFSAGCDDFVGKPFRENEVFDIMARHLALKYVYEDMQPEEAASAIASDISLNLSALSADLSSALSRAVTNTDATKITEIAEQINAKEPALAQALQILAKNFDYGTIRMALQKHRDTKE